MACYVMCCYVMLCLSLVVDGNVMKYSVVQCNVWDVMQCNAK